ncbi:hypothetical protein DINM_000351 [Dirofilaria immitis]|nr:hypothetical protein [Dirofilaria immitis]
MADDSKDVLNLLNEAGEAVITLNICHEKSTTETMKRILPWLDAIGENLQYFSTEVVIESKIPTRILDKVYMKQKNNKKIRRCMIETIPDRTRKEEYSVESNH